ncbi:M3 family metallopeptidase [Pigmentiphaga litoralis]|uniref:oligopeptidase A n=1 Tax=Pigmentiphaga litoralis TaxID=516702 RepID=A0A7Y9LL37_9BURK|nr:M3 family metallopeptidase [Pigmentiphaga litoralis]NYE22821.1 oligopeptidase A [Pigmentiphaga litoralis]NYE83564.1 oligopeptidase A [Pigmentiphaga litoralis]
MTATDNPLLATQDLQAFDAIKPEHIGPAITELIDQARQAVDRAADPALPPTWDAVIEPLDDAAERLSRAWSAAGHLNSVVNTPELREAYNASLPSVTDFWTWVGLHEGLYRQYRRVHDAPDFASLSPARRRIIELALRDFRLSGVELPEQERARYAEISSREAEITNKFSENVLDATDAFALYVDDEARLKGIPSDVLDAAAAAAKADEKTGWKLTLQIPSYMPVMQYADDRSLREALYRAYGTRASELGDPAFDNSPLISELLALRAEESGLLGYKSFADKQLESRMAGNPDAVFTFLRDLAARAKPFARKDVAELREFAKAKLGMDDLEPWDMAYVSEKLRTDRYDYSEQEVKKYFTEPRVIAGLFEVVEKLFSVKLETVDAPKWHPTVRPVRISRDGKLVGHLYFDLYARSGKQGGAWVDLDRNRRLRNERVQTPVGFLTCNFAAPGENRPSLLTHDDVITLFHEMGHALHLVLSEVDELGASPFSSVEWDAIELPSQFMENFCWEWPVVSRMSAHVDTGEPLPRALFDRMLAARNFQVGLQTVRQLEFSLFDMTLHHQATGLSIEQVLAAQQTVRDEVAVLFPPAWHRSSHSFSHIFAGGYGAGYYSYKWAEVLSADAYAAFEEAAKAIESAGGDTLLPAVGERFRKEILAVGGSRPAIDSFRAFRGREPSIDALLRHSGMVAEAN